MAGDASFASVSTLLHADASPLTDLATTPKVYTAFGGATISGTAKFGTGSIGLSGGNSYYNTPWHADFDLGTGAFTAECFFRCTTISAAMCIYARCSGTGGITRESSVSVLNSTTIQIYYGIRGSGSTTKDFTVPTLSTGTWYHLAVVRDGSGNWKVFINGTASSTTWNDATNLDASLPFMIGAFYAGAVYNPFDGFIDEFRLTKGIARYSSNFTAPTAPFIAGLGQISGVVRDGAGILTSRTVRAYRRDTGALVGSAVSDPTTGAYSIDCATLDEVSRIVLDDASGTLYNDIVDRVIPA